MGNSTYNPETVINPVDGGFHFIPRHFLLGEFGISRVVCEYNEMLICTKNS